MDVVLGLCIITGGALAYAHQSYKIISTRSAHGVSLDSAALNFISSCILVANVVVLKHNEWFVWDGTEAVIRNTTAFAQIFGSMVWTGVVGALVVWFTESPNGKKVAIASVLWSVIAFMGIVLTDWAGIVVLYAQILGILASLLTIVIWVPQIILLARTRDPGELSWVLITIEALGGGLAVIYQAVLNHEDWTTWASTAILVAEQIIILSLLVTFRVRQWRSTGEEEHPDIEMTEFPQDFEELSSHPEKEKKYTD